MPDLHEDAASFGMNRVRHAVPACHVRGTIDTALTHEGAGMGIHHGAFRHNEAAGRTLGVIVHHHVVRYMRGAGPHAGEGSHHDAIG